MTQTSDTEWSLSKTGALDTANSTVTWTVTATQGATVAGHLVINGTITVENTGVGGATIGNIVVNLQTKSGSSWVTKSSDVADATNDDAATSANVMASASSEGTSQFTENAASGRLLFMDAATNTIFSLVPQVTIPGGTIRTLLFSAAFDNNVLHLATGTATRTEMIVSFGNATASGNSVPNVDINGNGVIDSDEGRIRSVPARLGLSVPAQTNGNTQVTLSDTLDDITSTGTVTFGNAVFNLGATGGTVTVSYTGGTDGGTLTNCAHLTSPDTTVTSGGFTFSSVAGFDLQACDTQTIGGHTCTPGAPGCGWVEGNMHTYPQGDWGDDPAVNPAAALLDVRWDQVYASSFGVLEVGIPGTGGYSIAFGGASSALAYLPSTGTPAPLNSDLIDPTSSASGAFGGEVVALELNTDFSASGFLAATVPFGTLNLCGVPGLPEMSVDAFRSVVNAALGGGSTGFNVLDLSILTNTINAAFVGGSPSTFAQEHLYNGACP